MNSVASAFRERVEQDGFAVVPNVLSAETVEELAAGIAAVLNRDGTGGGDHALRHLLRSVPAVRRLAESTAVRQLVGPVLGPDCLVVRSLFFDKTEGKNWKVAWHQDLTIAVAEKLHVPGFTAWSVKAGVVHVQPPAAILERMITVRLHLDPCEAANGPLEVIPRSHKSGRLNPEAIAGWKQRQSPEVCLVPSGGAVLMRPLLLHASSAAVTAKHRRVVHLEFAAELLPNELRWAGV